MYRQRRYRRSRISQRNRENIEDVVGVGRVPRAVGSVLGADGCIRIVLNRDVEIDVQHFHNDNNGWACVSCVFDGYFNVEQLLTGATKPMVTSFRNYRVRGIGMRLYAPDPPSEGGMWTVVSAQATNVARWPAATSMEAIDRISSVGDCFKRVQYCRSGGSLQMYSAWPVLIDDVRASVGSDGGQQVRGAWVSTDDTGRQTKHWGNKWMMYKANHYGLDSSGTVLIGDRYPSNKMVLAATMYVDLKDPVLA